MPDPVEYQTQYVEQRTGAPPPPPGEVPAAGASRVVTTTSSATEPGFRGRQLVWMAVAIVDVVLALRVIFFVAGANNVGFAHFIYALGGAFEAPFRGIFNASLVPGDHPVQWASVLAIVIYTGLAWVLDRIIAIATTPSPRRGASARF